MYVDYTYIVLVLPAVIFAMWASAKVNSTYQKYSQERNARVITGAQAARMVLDANGLSDVRVERIQGNLTDHFDPRTNTLRLSDSVYDSSSAAAIGVAAHEVGHAIQHAEGYMPIRLRSALVPAVSFASRFTWLLVMAGLLMMSVNEYGIGYYVMLGGIGLFSVVTLFELVTLPCEFNASRRAMAALRDCGYYGEEELSASRKVLTAAALTYVAALATSVIQLLRLISRVSNRRR
jgi:Zn-dependent membrane protease YugP